MIIIISLFKLGQKIKLLDCEEMVGSLAVVCSLPVKAVKPSLFNLEGTIKIISVIN